MADTMTLEQIHEAVQKGYSTLHELNEKAEKERKEQGEVLGQTKEVLGKVDERLNALEERAEKLETSKNRPGVEPADQDHEERHAAWVKAFDKWARRGAVGPDEAKLLSTDDLANGGALVIDENAPEIERLLVERSPVRELARVTTLTQGGRLRIPLEGSTAFQTGWIAERQSRSETTTGTTAEKFIDAHGLYANPKVTVEMLADSGYDVEGWINESLAEQFAKTEGTGFISGTGMGQPEGLLTNPDVGERETANSGAIVADDFLNLKGDLPEFYANNGVFLVKRSTKTALRLLKDGQGQYLWQPSLQAGSPPTFDGSPIREAVDMPAISGGNTVALFGDFRNAYWIIDKSGMTMIRDAVTEKGFVLFYTERRTGGGVYRAEAVKKLTVKS